MSSNDGNESKVQYGFGFGSSMKRMVRILRSTVMVRVGGDMFADDLRSTGSSTAHQMEMFKRKTSGASSTTSSLVGYSGGQGPIMKHLQSYSSRRASDNGLLDDSRIPRPASSQSHSRQGSRNNLLDSNPPSRSDSFNLDRPTRIPSLRGPKVLDIKEERHTHLVSKGTLKFRRHQGFKGRSASKKKRRQGKVKAPERLVYKSNYKEE
uniref:GAR domain-containing protein n=1 Tax=Ditylenchus dipsaci TaxID=166011 RepID=A0A915EK76_9BILA